MRRRNPGAFLKFTFIVFSQVQCVLGSQVSAEKKQLPREDMWKRRVVNKHHRCSCCGQKHVCTYVVGGRVGMNETCYFTFDMKKLVPTPPHPTPSHVMCRQSVESHMCASAKERHHPHPTPSHVMCAQSVESHMRALQVQKNVSIPTPSLFLINIHPLLSPPPTPQKSLCIPYKLRVGFILTVNLYVTPANPGEIVVYTV